MPSGRASLIAYFMLTDVMGLGFLAREGLVTRDTGLLALAFLPALAAGVWLGSRSFRIGGPRPFPQDRAAVLAVPRAF